MKGHCTLNLNTLKMLKRNPGYKKQEEDERMEKTYSSLLNLLNTLNQFDMFYNPSRNEAEKYFKQDQDQEENEQQEQDQGEDEDPDQKLWRKEMLRRTG